MSDIPKPGAAKEAAPKKDKPESKEIAVEAIEKGYYPNTRRNVGDKFFIASEKDFSKNWMKKI